MGAGVGGVPWPVLGMPQLLVPLVLLPLQVPVQLLVGGLCEGRPPLLEDSFFCQL